MAYQSGSLDVGSLGNSRNIGKLGYREFGQVGQTRYFEIRNDVPSSMPVKSICKDDKETVSKTRKRRRILTGAPTSDHRVCSP